ncbi:MAG: PstS family phosphate ABC transporter substrate-binding protein [Bacteroidia bacterium]
MKKITALTLACIVALAFTLPKSDITVKGSDTILPLSQKEAENFMKSNPNVTIAIVGGGSGVGIASLIDGTTDIAMASRDLKMDEKLKLQPKHIKQITIGVDALAIIVNPANKVNQLTREQLEGIFTGKIVNWKDVGGADEKIIAFSRESSSGTYEFMKEHVMSKKNYGAEILSAPATGAIVESVSQTKGAIGYVGLAYLNKSIKAIAASFDGKTFVTPSIASAKNKTYPIARPLFYIYAAASENKVKPFVDYILSPQGQKTVEEVGYIPLK